MSSVVLFLTDTHPFSGFIGPIALHLLACHTKLLTPSLNEIRPLSAITMSMQRVCHNCYRTEGIRANFGNDREAEAAYHRRIWCDCGYSSPEEMMKDQDLGFDDPRWRF